MPLIYIYTHTHILLLTFLCIKLQHITIMQPLLSNAQLVPSFFLHTSPISQHPVAKPTSPIHRSFTYRLPPRQAQPACTSVRLPGNILDTMARVVPSAW